MELEKIIGQRTSKSFDHRRLSGYACTTMSYPKILRLSSDCCDSRQRERGKSYFREAEVDPDGYQNADNGRLRSGESSSRSS